MIAIALWASLMLLARVNLYFSGTVEPYLLTREYEKEKITIHKICKRGKKIKDLVHVGYTAVKKKLLTFLEVSSNFVRDKNGNIQGWSVLKDPYSPPYH